MAYNVKFLKGTSESYANLVTKDANTFYYVDGTDLYLGTIKLSNSADLAAAITRIAKNETSITNITADIGDLESLATTEKGTLIGAINEIKNTLASTAEGGEVSISTTATTEGMLKSYTITQGQKQVGVIDIPKDLVISKGSIEVNPEGKDPGTYIVLEIANSTDKLYIDVKDLIDVYTALENAAQVQLAVSADNVLSATIVAGSIGTTELADGAVTTAKIATGNVTLEKLSTAVQNSLKKADDSVQSVVAGTTNGTIAVDGTDVAVTGLGTAAYTNADAYDTAGAAAAVLGTDSDTANSDTVKGAKAYAADLDSKMDTRVDALEAAIGENGSVATQISNAIDDLDVTDTAVTGQYVSAVSETNGKISVTRENLPDYSKVYDAYGAAATAETNANTYTDTALTWGTIA